jgi:hypothetical protein
VTKDGCAFARSTSRKVAETARHSAGGGVRDNKAEDPLNCLKQPKKCSLAPR